MSARALLALLTRRQFSSGRRLHWVAAAAERLRAVGFAVVDAALSPEDCSVHRSEILALRDADQLHLNSSHLLDPSGSRTLLQKVGVWEAEVTHDAQTAARCPTIAAHASCSALRTYLSIHLQGSFDSQACKVQYNTGEPFALSLMGHIARTAPPVHPMQSVAGEWKAQGRRTCRRGRLLPTAL